MVPPRKRRFHHGDLRRQLVVIASALVYKKGHQAFSLRELAECLGVTEPAIYRHYPSRDALLEEVALHGLERFVAKLDDVTARAEDPFDAILVFGQEYVRFAVTNAAWFRLQSSRSWKDDLVGMLERLGPEEAERARFRAQLAKVLPPGDDRAADLYRLVWGTAHGLATLLVERAWELPPRDPERFATADEALRLLVDSLRARAGTGSVRS